MVITFSRLGIIHPLCVSANRGENNLPWVPVKSVFHVPVRAQNSNRFGRPVPREPAHSSHLWMAESGPYSRAQIPSNNPLYTHQINLAWMWSISVLMWSGMAEPSNFVYQRISSNHSPLVGHIYFYLFMVSIYYVLPRSHFLVPSFREKYLLVSRDT